MSLPVRKLMQKNNPSVTKRIVSKEYVDKQLGNA